MRPIYLYIFLLTFISCKQTKEKSNGLSEKAINTKISYANGFAIEKYTSGLTVISIASPWPNAELEFKYALIPKEKESSIILDKKAFDAIITVPVQSLVVTSTTHIPALESLGVLDRLVGFPDTDYISSKAARELIRNDKIKELGHNEILNTEAVVALQPQVVIGFALNAQNKAYNTLIRANIPVIFNGDWAEETPLGKAEWIKFFAPFFNKEQEANIIFNKIEKDYIAIKKLAATATKRPTVLSGAMYKDVWYLPGGKSWAAQFLKDANADYLWQDSKETGSLSLSWESVLDTAYDADFWIAPAQFTSYQEMENASKHYARFSAFSHKNIFTFSKTLGETGGVLYYELGPQRPDLVLKDLVSILHPEIVLNHNSYFFKPLN